MVNSLQLIQLVEARVGNYLEEVCQVRHRSNQCLHPAHHLVQIIKENPSFWEAAVEPHPNKANRELLSNNPATFQQLQCRLSPSNLEGKEASSTRKSKLRRGWKWASSYQKLEMAKSHLSQRQSQSVRKHRKKLRNSRQRSKELTLS